MSVIVAVLFVAVVAGIAWLFPTVLFMFKNAYAVRGLPKHPKEHWFFGHMPYVFGNEGNLMHWLRTMVLPFAKEGHKLTVTSTVPGLNRIDLLHPDTIRSAFGSDPKSKEDYFALEPWLGDGLLTSNGPKWSRHRRLLTNAFHFDVLKSYIGVYSECTSIFMDQLIKNQKNGDSIDVVPYVRQFTLDVLLRCICGQETSCQTNSSHNYYVEAVYALSELSLERMRYFPAKSELIYHFMPMKRQYSKHNDIVHKFATEVIEKRRKQFESQGTVPPAAGKKKYLDFIDILLAVKDEDGNGLTDLEIRDEVDTFMFEGHDTTANSLCWILYLLAKHPEHQAKCREEVDEIFKNKDELEWNDLKELTYVHYFMKEANRLFPPVPVVTRQLASQRCIDGHVIPAGTTVVAHIYIVQHNPHVWDDPETFDPLRFTPENSEGRDPMAFVPFSAGPRNCIGQNFAVYEEKMFLALLLHNFEIALDEEKPTKPKSFILLHPDQVCLKLKKI